ncbi:MAG: DUF234 domain-containing protein [Candidatus Eremiobacterota bacterium]
MQRLLDIEMVRKDQPFGSSERDSKRTFYSLADPFLSFWFRFIGPHGSWLGQRLVEQVKERIRPAFPGHVAVVWEQLAQQSVPSHRPSAGSPGGPARRWWGPGNDGKPTNSAAQRGRSERVSHFAEPSKRLLSSKLKATR